MNVCQLVMLLYVGLSCLATGFLAMPTVTKSRSHRANSNWSPSASYEKRRFRSEDRRLKFLQKMLRKLEAEDIQWLVRQKKMASYSDYELSPIVELDTVPPVFTNTAQSTEDMFYRELGRRKTFLEQPERPETKCPMSEDGFRLLKCPTPDRADNDVCIDGNALCDGVAQCPGGEDEDPSACMFYKYTLSYIKRLSDAISRIAQ